MRILNMKIRDDKEISIEQLLNLYNSVGWKNYTNEPLKLFEAVKNSTYVVTCWKGDKLVGLARGLSDDVSIFYLQDILVNSEYQGKGIGKELLSNCLNKHKNVRHKVLITDDDERLFRFYESFGYKNLKKLKKNDINAFLKFSYVDLE